MTKGHQQDLRGWVTEHADRVGQLAGQTALVEGDDLELAGTVEITTGGRVIVHCDEECGFPGDTRTVTVSIFSPAAYVRLTGSARAEGKEIYCAPEMLIEHVDRRRWPRARLDLPVVLCPVQGTDIDAVPGRTVDISVGGACVETLSPVDRSNSVTAVIRMADGHQIHCVCATIAVEKVEEGWRYRLSFTDLDSAGASRLAELTAA